MPLALAVVALLALLVVSICLGVALGTVGVPLEKTVVVLVDHLVPGVDAHGYSAVQDQFVWEFRMPRVLLAAIVGAGLAVVGTVMQAVVRNPLADPYVLGVSSGAGFGAVLAFLVLDVSSGAVRYGASFLGALAALALVLALAGQRGRLTPGQVVLVGVSLAYIFTALTSFLIYRSDDPRAAQSVVFWLLGTLQDATFSVLAVPAVAVAVGLAAALWYGRGLNALVIGDETAAALGYEVHRMRMVLLVAGALVTGVLVSVAGGVAFVGLIVPHAVRLVIGSDHRRLLIVSALSGAVFLVLVDIACRFAARPEELPLGVVTAVLGGPYFLYLLRSRGRTRVLG
ncbi:MAG: iron complex transport system permease protein [Solirubrobacteraceae bacterium]|nr:iron complex transport system permease protein [Solirubrobacteraceae bacterium]